MSSYLAICKHNKVITIYIFNIIADVNRYAMRRLTMKRLMDHRMLQTKVWQTVRFNKPYWILLLVIFKVNKFVIRVCYS